MTSADLKKGISYVAFGFLFTLVNINLNFNSGTLNITPDWIGWILFFFAYVLLGEYVAGKPYLRWVPLVMVILTGAAWILKMARPELDAGILTTVTGVVSAAYMFILFGVLETIGSDYDSHHTETIRTLKYVNLAVYVLTLVLALIVSVSGSTAVAGLFLIAGVIMLVAAIVTLVVLLKFRKEMQDRMEDWELRHPGQHRPEGFDESEE